MALGLGLVVGGMALAQEAEKKGSTVRIVVEGEGDEAVPRVAPSVPAESRVSSAQGPTTFGSAAAQAMGPSLKYGQSFQDYGPKTIPSGPLKPGAQITSTARPVAGGEDVVSEKLEGIAFLGTPGEVSAAGMASVRGITSTVPGLDAAAAKEIAGKYLGGQVRMKDLLEICRQVTAYFQDKNQPVVTAMIPEQEVRGGVVQILVVRGKLGKVKVQGNRYFKTENIQNTVRLRDGEDIDVGTLTDDVNWLNSNPFRQVTPSLAPSDAPGKTDVVLEVKDRFPFRPFVAYDNFGIQSLGYDRYSTGFTFMDVWTGLDQQVNYQYLTSGGFNNLIANSGAYSLALPWQHNLAIFGSYSKSNPTDVGPLDQSGYYWQASGRYTIPLPTLSLVENLDYRHQIYFGYDFKAANSDIFFSGQNLTPTTGGLVGLYQISQFSLGYSLTMSDIIGSTGFETVMYGSPGGMSSNNDNTSFQNINAGAKAQYVYGKFSLNRMFRLPGDAAVVLSGQIQQTSQDLMPSESFGIGGYDTVRGYDQRAANGDNGYLGNVELRSPPVSFWQICGADEALDRLVLLGFFDWGQTMQYSS
ncbi:ShlB/FhaC/HecB family hemolysin secretion/activation protein, partial [bacterium]|nr:ShlB/FhaC/HecB family hemolysin secretion/activation protein [bacterium]